jgi:hypothetical protein
VKQTPLTRKAGLGRKTELKAHAFKERRPSKKSRQDGVRPRAKKLARPKRSYTRVRQIPTTPAEAIHKNRVVRLGCWCCRKEGVAQVGPTKLHHIRAGYGGSQRASNWEVIPLCEGHHQGMLAPVDPLKLAFHKAPRTWQARYGTEVEILEATWAAMGLDIEDLPQRRRESGYAEKNALPPWWDAWKRNQEHPHIPEAAKRVLIDPIGATVNGFVGPFLVGFATCGGLLLILGLGVWIGIQVATKKKGTPQG